MKREFGEVPGFEFEAPPGRAGGEARAVPPGTADPLRALRPSEAGLGESPMAVRLASRVLDVMRSRNLVTNLAVPVIAAVVVGIATVAIVGGGGTGGTGGTAASSALATGFPPARLAGADFTGSVATAPVVLASVAASAGTEVVAGSAAGGPALWVSDDGGSAWRRGLLAGPAALTRAGGGQFTAVAHGAAGWLAVGTVRAGQRGPLVASSPDGRKWTMARGMSLPGAAATAVAAGPAGYVIVGRRPAGGGMAAVAWSARGLAGWRQEPVASPAATVPTAMNAVTATARGYAAVGSAGPRPAAWVSATGRSWRPVAVPLPAGAASAALDYVASNGSDVVAAGTAVSPAGVSHPFTAVSGDGGATWAPLPLPAPPGAVAAATVTGLTAAGQGFVAVGTENAPGGADVVVWTGQARSSAGSGARAAWTVVAPQGTGLAGPGTQALTALTAQGATLTGVGFTVTSAAQQPTLWQSPIRH